MTVNEDAPEVVSPIQREETEQTPEPAYSFWDSVQTVLDFAGMVSGIGIFADVANAQKGQTEPHLIKDIGALINDPAKFAQCTIDCAAEVLDVNTAAKAGVAASGLNVLPADGKPGGTTPGTSPASKFFRKIFGNLRFPRRVPAPTLKQGISARTVKVGTFAGRVVPIVGTASLFPDVRALDQCVATCVRPGE